ncbi:MAG TPA: hypothetical protein VMT50_11865 [Steroidobacteraceae bacterium]|nr:hypothetical protein [Steroidobacteraceae bacterium]
MSLNLHATVRAAVQAVNADIAASYYESVGYTPDGAGRQLPLYDPAVDVMIQIQPPTSRDLRHMEYLNIQGTTRVVYLYSHPDAIRRVDAKGGDLLQFSSFEGDPVDNWLVAAVPERWNVGTNNSPESQLPASPPTSGWSKLYCVLQVDRPVLQINIVTDDGQNIVTQGGAPIVTQGQLP